MAAAYSPEKRTPEQLRNDYEIEKELAARLRRASREERAGLYAQIYNELFQRVSTHPQWTKRNTERRETVIASQVRLIEPYLDAGAHFLEVGAGDCALSVRVAARVATAYAVEVSEELTRDVRGPANFRLLVSDGCRVPLPDASVDVAYSFQLMEHIHPEDAVDQLRESFRLLRPSGVYCCVTPNRLSGPHDISHYFDREAQGLHLKEYSVRDLAKLYKQTGFREVWLERPLFGRRLRMAAAPIIALERVLESLPWRIRVGIARSSLVSRLLNMAVFGRK